MVLPLVGPHSRIGGEVNNSCYFSLFNKGHDGFRKPAWGMVYIGAILTIEPKEQPMRK
jgi:hypothetical protein